MRKLRRNISDIVGESLHLIGQIRLIPIEGRDFIGKILGILLLCEIIKIYIRKKIETKEKQEKRIHVRKKKSVPRHS